MDTWFSRDLPTLRVVAQLLDEGHTVTGDELTVDGLSPAEVARALKALEGEYLTRARHYSLADNHDYDADSLTSAGRRAAGMWPTPEGTADAMIAALERIATASPNPDKQSRARQVLSVVTGAGRDLLVEVSAAALSRSAGLG